jgi:hypothetical protein
VKRIITLLVFIGSINYASAQKFGQKLSAGLNLDLIIPSGEFSKFNDNIGYGARGWVMYNPARSVPLHFGIELGYNVMGSRTAYFQGPYFDQYKLDASNNIFSLLFRLRVQNTKTNAVKPFAEAMLGWNDFFSTVNIERQTYYNTSYNDSYGNSSEAHWAMTFGGGGGLSIRLSKDGKEWIDVKAIYMIGRKTTYLTDPTIYTNGTVTFDSKTSETNMWIPQVGIKFGL